MTREEIEHLASVKYPSWMTEAAIWYNKGLLEGLRTADANPKSPWISSEEDLPFKHKELLYEIKNSIYPSTKPVLIRTKENIHEVSFMYNNDGWQWDFELDIVTHWMPIPEIPKE